jgi:hypothetical protein
MCLGVLHAVVDVQAVMNAVERIVAYPVRLFIGSAT